MNDTVDYEDAPEPSDALGRVVEAVSSGATELDPGDLHALSRFAADSANTIRELLAGLDSAGRFALMERLHEVGSDFGGYDFTAIFAAMTADEDESVRTLAVNGLEFCETAPATQALLAVAQSEEESAHVRQEAVSALGEVAMRLELGWASGEAAASVVPVLRAIAEDVQEEEPIRAAAVSAVGVISEEWVADLIDEAFHSGDEAMRLGALHAMGRSADPAWLSVLEDALVAEDEDERLAAVQAVGEVGSEDGAPMLLELFDDPSSTQELLLAVVAALGEIGSEEAVEELQRLRTHPDPNVRATAQSALEDASMDDFDGLGSLGGIGGLGGGGIGEGGDFAHEPDSGDWSEN